MANLIVEIGNTALKAALAEGMVLGKTFRYQGERKIEYILSLVEKEKPEFLTIASVYPISSQEEDFLRAHFPSVLILDGNHGSPAEYYNLPSYLTYDRGASIVAARHLFKGKPCTLIDLGTTLTVDFIDSEGNYAGGNISLGCRTRFKALNRYTKSLPLVETPEKIEEYGKSIQSSIESGIISGIVFEIGSYIERYPDNMVLFTGGDANYFVKQLKKSIFVVCNLVLIGLAIVTDEYVERNLQ